MGASGVSLTDAGHGGKGRSGAAGPKHDRRNLPVARAILWSPGDATRSGAADRPAGPESYEPFIHRSVIAGINRHVNEDGEPRFGFLLGHLHRCPDTGIRYSVADTAIAATDVLLEDASGSYLIRAWADAQSVFAGHSGVLLGWYHSHLLLGLSLSGSDEDANERYFGQPWQTSIVVVPDPVRPMGGVFRFDPDAGVAERRRPAPFYELLDDQEDSVAGAASAVVWTNYEIDRGEPVAEVKAGRFEMTARPLERERSVGPTRPVQLVIPGDGKSFGMFPAFRRRAWWPIGVFATVMLFVALLTIARGLDRSPVTTLPQSRTIRTLEERRFFDAVDGLAIALERYAERSADYEAGRIGCDLLATGYAGADASFVRIAARFGELGPEPAEDAQGAYDTSTTEIAAINTHFDGSGCPRP